MIKMVLITMIMIFVSVLDSLLKKMVCDIFFEVHKKKNMLNNKKEPLEVPFLMYKENK